ncbi:CLUMA_CG019887, isoform A [Clunio marinus]|uniref:CLUMA_CG019887, isoform A n=1 Tax=Clunio marinus TaxID=568069 RepID=A0A1J1J294_9DIPT|nr:CLUMA_CG019887, isoform A [Clunio marinus]
MCTGALAFLIESRRSYDLMATSSSSSWNVVMIRIENEKTKLSVRHHTESFMKPINLNSLLLVACHFIRCSKV